MNDCKGKELKPGQKVVFSVGTNLVTGEVQRVRVRRSRYHDGMQVANVILDVPIKKYGRGAWQKNADGSYFRNENDSMVWIPGPEKTSQTVHTVYSSDRILILDNSTE